MTMRLAPRWRGLAVAGLSLLTGCVSAYQRPSLDLPDRFAHAASTPSAAAIDPRWWRAFADANLDAMVEQALASNRDLTVAALTLRKARLAAGVARLNQLPTASGALGASRIGDVSAFTADVSVRYEVDLWARLASVASAAQWEANAAAQDRDAVTLAIIDATLTLYWDIGFTNQQIATGQAALADQRRIVELVDTQYRLGAVSGVERAEAAQALMAQIATVSALNQHLVEDRAAMALLLGDAARPPSWEPQTLWRGALPEIPVGAPASLLSRRPDVRAAEMRLRKTLAAGDATRAELYPALGLTGGGAAASPALVSLFANPTGSLVAALTLPFLDYPRHRLNDRIARVDFDIAALAFKTALFQALSDTDNALSNRTELARQGDALERALTAARTAERLYGVRYRSGAVALRIWLDAQQSARAAQTAYDNNRLARLVNQSTLYQALGGGV